MRVIMSAASLRLSFSLLAFSLLPSTGTAAEGCLTNAEARKIWPRQHLYWHTQAHCWDTSTRAEWKAKASHKASPVGFAWSRPAVPWIETLSWMWGQSFEKNWHEEVSDLDQLTPPVVRQFGFFAAFPAGK
jgi:hypothetical protein